MRVDEVGRLARLRSCKPWRLARQQSRWCGREVLSGTSACHCTSWIPPTPRPPTPTCACHHARFRIRYSACRSASSPFVAKTRAREAASASTGSLGPPSFGKGGESTASGDETVFTVWPFSPLCQPFQVGCGGLRHPSREIIHKLAR